MSFCYWDSIQCTGNAAYRSMAKTIDNRIKVLVENGHKIEDIVLVDYILKGNVNPLNKDYAIQCMKTGKLLDRFRFSIEYKL